jgi:hypothetical protein
VEESFIDVSKLVKTQAVFERFRTDMKNNRDKTGAVKAFEWCYELSWKVMRQHLAESDETTFSCSWR